MEFIIVSTERLSTSTTVEAESYEEAKEQVSDMFDTEKIILGSENYVGRTLHSSEEKKKERRDRAYLSATSIVLTNKLTYEQFQNRDIGMMTNSKFDFWEEEMVIELILDMVSHLEKHCEEEDVS